MKYTLDELRTIIKPMIESLPPDQAADAVVEVIRQDREALANKIEHILEGGKVDDAER
jgi:hypothetical protein